MHKMATRWRNVSKTLLFLTFLAPLTSLEEGASIVGENRKVYFSSPTNALKEGTTRIGKMQDQLTLRIRHLVVKF